MEVIAYGNGPLLAAILSGIANFMATSAWNLFLQTILALALVLGVIGYRNATAQNPVTSHGVWAVKGVIVLAILYLSTAGTVNMYVYDPLNNFNTKINNVPIAIALPYKLENSIANNLSELYGNYFAPSGYASEFLYNNPSDSAGFYNPGMVTPARAIKQATEAIQPDMEIERTLTSFMTNCVVPALIINPPIINLNAINNSGDIESLVKSDMPNMPSGWTFNEYATSTGTSIDYIPGGTSVACNTGYTDVINDINFTTDPNISIGSAPNGTLANNFTNQFDATTGTSQSTPSDVELLGASASFLFNTSLTGQQVLAQAALIMSLSRGLQNFATDTGTSYSAQAQAITQAMSQTQNGWVTAGYLAGQILPIVYMILQGLVFALFPIVLALALIPNMTMKYMMLMFELLIWLATWPPIASVINFMVNFFMQKTAFHAPGQQGVFSVANFPYIASDSSIWVAATGAIMWMAPMLSLALVTGSAFALASVANSVSQGAHGSAISAGSSVGSSSGLQGVQGNAASVAGIDEFSKKGINPTSAYDKMAGMSALEGFTGASGFQRAEQAIGLKNLIKGNAGNTIVSASIGATELPEALQIGQFKGDQAIGDMQGVTDYALSQGMSVQQISAVMGELGAFNSLNQERGLSQALGGPLSSQQANVEMTGINAFNTAKTDDMVKLYESQGYSPLQAAQMTARSQGIAVAIQNGKETEIFGSNGKIVMTLGQSVTSDGHYESWVKNGKGQIIYGTNRAGVSTENNTAITNTSGDSHVIYPDTYNFNLSNTPAMLAFASKGPGAGGHLTRKQLEDYRRILSSSNPAEKASFIQQNYQKYAETYKIDQTNAENFAGKLEAWLNAYNQGQVGFTVFGSGDKFEIKAGGKLVGEISYSQVNAMRVNQLNQAVANGDFSNVHSFTGLKREFNKIFHNDQPIENKIYRWAKKKIKGLEKNGVENKKTDTLIKK